MKKISLPKKITIKKIVKENFETKTFMTDERILARPGQFIMVWLPGKAEKPFSLIDDKPVTFTVKSVGKFTKYFNAHVKPGQQVWYRGPFGRGVFKSVYGRKVFVCGGCGCAPLHFFAKNLKFKKTITIIIGAKNKEELLFVKRFSKMGLKTITATDDGSWGVKGLASDLLEQVLAKQKIGAVYGCGPEPMMRRIDKLCRQYGVKYQLCLESLIKCGLGLCGSCVKNEKLVCLDGPVFSKWPS